MSPFLLIPSWVSLSILPFVAEILKRAICTCFSWICSFQDNNALLFCYAREILFSRLALSCSSSWHNGPFPPGNTLLSWLWWPSFLSSGFPPCFWILLRLVCKLLRFFCHHSSSVPANSQTSQTLHTLPWKPPILTDFGCSLCWGPNLQSTEPASVWLWNPCSISLPKWFPMKRCFSSISFT